MTPRFTDDVLSLRSLDALLATSTFEPFEVAGLAARHGTPDGNGLTQIHISASVRGAPAGWPVGRKKHDAQAPRACAQSGTGTQ